MILNLVKENALADKRIVVTKCCERKHFVSTLVDCELDGCCYKVSAAFF